MGKYEDALGKARQIKHDIETMGCKAIDIDMLEVIFPELGESEDERIRKHLIEIVETYWGKTNDPGKAADLAYLEKQKEQKPSTPKFRIGDVMRTKQEAAKGITDGLPVIVSVDDNYYYCTNEKIPISEQDEYEFPPMNVRQKPAEWSKEDEKLMEDIIFAIREFWYEKDAKRMIDKLKSLRPQPHWKPSAEQME